MFHWLGQYYDGDASMQWGGMNFQYRVVYDDLHSTMLFLADFAGNGKWKACR